MMIILLRSLLASLCLCSLVYNSSVNAGNSSADHRLLMVFLLSRHGDRSPVNDLPSLFPSSSWPIGLGQLTPQGAREHVQLGRIIRLLYKDVIPEAYNKVGLV